MDARLTRHWGLFWTGAAIFILGIVFLFFPTASLVTMAIWFGVILIVGGIAEIISYWALRNTFGMSGWSIAAGALDIIIGIIFLAHPLLTANVLPWLAGWALIFYGIMVFFAAGALRETGVSLGASIANGVVAIICGILFFAFPVAFMYVLAFFLIFRGITLMVYGASKQPLDPTIQV